jgi:hypothetical protein
MLSAERTEAWGQPALVAEIDHHELDARRCLQRPHREVALQPHHDGKPSPAKQLLNLAIR